MRAADTNVVIRLIVRDDARQLAMASALLADGLSISTVVAMETVRVLESVYSFGRGDIAAAMKMVLELEACVTEDDPAIRTALLLYESTPQVGFEDCLTL